MPILQVEIIDPRAEKLLADLAEMNLIHIGKNRDTPPVALQRQAGWGKDIIAKVLPSFDEPLEEFKEYE